MTVAHLIYGKSTWSLGPWHNDLRSTEKTCQAVSVLTTELNLAIIENVSGFTQDPEGRRFPRGRIVVLFLKRLAFPCHSR